MALRVPTPLKSTDLQCGHLVSNIVYFDRAFRPALIV
jgi:hypothetical protein